MEALEGASWIATFLGTVANLPQLWRILHNKNSENISVISNSLWVGIVFVMFLRALLIVHDPVFMVSNGAQFVVMLVLLGVILKFRRRRDGNRNGNN